LTCQNVVCGYVSKLVQLGISQRALWRLITEYEYQSQRRSIYPTVLSRVSELASLAAVVDAAVEVVFMVNITAAININDYFEQFR